MAKKKPDEKPRENIKREKFSQSLKVMLTQEEIADRADRAAFKVAAIQGKEADLKAVTQHHKGLIESDKAELSMLSKEVRDKSTYRQIDCEKQFDFNEGKVRVIRLDSGEL